MGAIIGGGGSGVRSTNTSASSGSGAATSLKSESSPGGGFTVAIKRKKPTKDISEFNASAEQQNPFEPLSARVAKPEVAGRSSAVGVQQKKEASIGDQAKQIFSTIFSSNKNDKKDDSSHNRLSDVQELEHHWERFKHQLHKIHLDPQRMEMQGRQFTE